MNISEERQKEYDFRLRQLAQADFDAFCRIAGIDLMQAYICLERSVGRSYGQIAQKFQMTNKQVEYRCKKCNGIAS